MNSPKVRLIRTEDGSKSLFHEKLNETYHSIKGARGESTYVFIHQGISQLSNTTIKVLEVGLGTGLNVLLTYQFVDEKTICVDYHTLEPYPIQPEIYQQLNYSTSEENQAIFKLIHTSNWGEEIAFSQNFTFTKYLEKLEHFDSRLLFDIIYFDAFAPSRQPEVWSLTNLQKCYSLLKKGGILVTYCAQGQFKRDLVQAGFKVETLPGALGKKEMVRAHK